MIFPSHLDMKQAVEKLETIVAQLLDFFTTSIKNKCRQNWTYFEKAIQQQKKTKIQRIFVKIGKKNQNI